MNINEGAFSKTYFIIAFYVIFFIVLIVFLHVIDFENGSEKQAYSFQEKVKNSAYFFVSAYKYHRDTFGFIKFKKGFFEGSRVKSFLLEERII